MGPKDITFVPDGFYPGTRKGKQSRLQITDNDALATAPATASDGPSTPAPKDNYLFIQVNGPGQNSTKNKRLIRSQAMLKHSRRQREQRVRSGLNFIQYEGSKRRLENKVATKQQSNSGPSLFLETSLDPFASLPQLPHLRRARDALGEVKLQATRWFSQPPMRQLILPLTAQHPAMFMGLMFQTCAAMDAMRGQSESLSSIAIKTETIRLINENLDDPVKALSAENIAAIAMVGAASNIHSLGDYSEYNVHRNGMDYLIDHRGGFQSFIRGKSTFDQIFLRILILHFFLTTERSNGTIPLRQIFTSLLDVEKPDVFDKPITAPESPLYCPNDFESFQRPCSRDPRILEQLRATREFIRTLELQFAADLPDKRWLFKYRKTVCEQCVREHSFNASEVTLHYVHESCRVATAILIHMFVSAQTAEVATDGTDFCARLKNALMKTDIETLWGEMVGVLWWIILIATPAARGKPEWPFFSALSTRLMFEMGYQNFYWKSCFIPIAKSIWLQKLCSLGADAAAIYRNTSFVDLGNPLLEFSLVPDATPSNSSPDSKWSEPSSSSRFTPVDSEDDKLTPDPCYQNLPLREGPNNIDG